MFGSHISTFQLIYWHHDRRGRHRQFDAWKVYLHTPVWCSKDVPPSSPLSLDVCLLWEHVKIISCAIPYLSTSAVTHVCTSIFSTPPSRRRLTKTPSDSEGYSE
ncbi:hypothetical protein Trydic_g10620 [Trypoxylus dichotomus]